MRRCPPNDAQARSELSRMNAARDAHMGVPSGIPFKSSDTWSADRSAEELLTYEQAAKRFCVSVDVLRRRARAGELSVYIDSRDRRRRLVAPADLDALFHPRPVTTVV
jgi:hypothetical protein